MFLRGRTMLRSSCACQTMCYCQLFWFDDHSETIDIEPILEDLGIIFWYPPSLAQSVRKNALKIQMVWKLLCSLVNSLDFHQKKSACQNSKNFWIYVHVKWRPKTLLNSCFGGLAKKLYETYQLPKIAHFSIFDKFTILADFHDLSTKKVMYESFEPESKILGIFRPD